ncbi:MAG: CPBP family intramembrane metalloprotease [Armatimonadetes bacterium]|nr:CPBP family intramembrane metalloprotease [Armatimonadota bacterium]
MSDDAGERDNPMSASGPAGASNDNAPAVSAQVRTPLDLLRAPESVAILVSTAGLVAVRYIDSDFRWLPQVARDARLGWFGLNFIVLFLVPALVWRLGYGKGLTSLGVRIGDWRASLRYALLYGGITLPLIVIASRWANFQGYYSNYIQSTEDVGLIVMMLAGWVVYFFAWEFHYRGFLLFALEPRLGAFAIIVQTIPFTLTHFGKPWPETASAIVAGIALGWWAYRSRSCLGPWLLHWICSATMQLAVAFWPAAGGP